MTDEEFYIEANEIKFQMPNYKEVNALLLIAKILHEIELHLASISLGDSRVDHGKVYK